MSFYYIHFLEISLFFCSHKLDNEIYNLESLMFIKVDMDDMEKKPKQIRNIILTFFGEKMFIHKLIKFRV